MPQKFFKTPFALDGDKEPIPELAQNDGKVSYLRGYTYEYERDLGQDPLALPIERHKFNQLQYDITRNLQDYQVYAFAPYITAEENEGEAYAYPKGGVCRYDDGSGLKAYVSIVDDNLNLPSVNGVIQSGWAKIMDAADNLVFKSDLATNVKHGLMRIATDAEAKAGLNNATAVTPYQMASNRTGSIVPLVAISASAPSGSFVTKDKYYNTLSKQIFTYSAGAWLNPERPVYGMIYQYSNYLFIWNGSILANIKYDIAGFYHFYEQAVPLGFKVRNGALLENASTDFAFLYEHLQNPNNAWKLRTEIEWQALSAIDPWNGIGGVPYFVLDLDADTIRLPDTRGMYAETSGFDGLNVGDVHGDAIRNFTGSVSFIARAHNGYPVASGAITFQPVGGGNLVGGNQAGYGIIGLDPSLVVPTANKNQPRAYGVLGCVYVGV